MVLDMRVAFSAPKHVDDVISRLGRTEDIRFSPDNKRLAVAEFSNNAIAIFDIGIGGSSVGEVCLSGVREIFSSHLSHPHGLDFIDNDTIIVANRDGGIAVFHLHNWHSIAEGEGVSLEIFGDFEGVRTPGSVAVRQKRGALYEALVCNNYDNTVTRHLLELNNGCLVRGSGVALRRWLDIPDGICVSESSQWVAISNHSTHCVLLYDVASLSEFSEPDGILGCVRYPHGLRFTGGDRLLLVADAGSPYVHIYGAADLNWRGVRTPLLSIRTMSDEKFASGRYNPQEGGPKGIDVTNDMSLFVTTNECQPIAFFDLQAALAQLEFAAA